MKPPLVVCIIPVYNTEKYLAECLDSINNQTYKNCLCLIIDDGSTDSSFEIARKYEALSAKAADNNKVVFRAYSKQNGGVSSARNYAFDLLKQADYQPDFVCFIDSDDIVTKDFVEQFVSAMSDNQADYAVSGIRLFDKTGIIPRQTVKTKPIVLSSEQIINHYFMVKEFAAGKNLKRRYLDTTQFLGLANKCFRYSTIKNHLFNEKLTVAEDQYFFMSVAENLRKGVVIDADTYLYRMRASSLCHDTSHFFRVKTEIDVLTSMLASANSTCMKEALAGNLFGRLYSLFQHYVMVKDKPQAKLYFLRLTELFSQYSNVATSDFKRRLNRFKYGFTLNFLYIYTRSKNRKAKKIDRTENTNSLFD